MVMMVVAAKEEFVLTVLGCYINTHSVTSMEPNNVGFSGFNCLLKTFKLSCKL